MVIICGGYDKHIPFEPLAETILTHRNIHTVVLTGATKNAIRQALEKHPLYSSRACTILQDPDFAGAVRLASASARMGDAVLLSPACASFDAFANFEERGNRFRELVEQITAAGPGKEPPC